MFVKRPKPHSVEQDVFEVSEYIFNISFTIELIWNMYGSWFFQFWKSGWYVFFFHLFFLTIKDRETTAHNQNKFHNFCATKLWFFFQSSFPKKNEKYEENSTWIYTDISADHWQCMMKFSLNLHWHFDLSLTI